MTLLDQVLTADEREANYRLVNRETLHQQELFGRLVELVSTLPEAFNKAGIDPVDLTKIYPLSWRAKSPGAGWAVGRRGNSVAFVSASGSAYLIHLKGEKVRGHEKTTFANVTAFMLHENMKPNDPNGVIQLVEGSNGDIKVAFRSQSVVSDLAKFINEYTLNSHKNFTLPIR